jgi:hypothetical protein
MRLSFDHRDSQSPRRNVYWVEMQGIAFALIPSVRNTPIADAQTHRILSPMPRFRAKLPQGVSGGHFRSSQRFAIKIAED